MKSNFLSKGFSETDYPETADVIVVNSCTVTASGDGKSLYSVRKLRKTNPDAIIALTGCLPQASPQAAEKISEADIITGTKERNELPQLVLDFINERKRIVSVAQYGSSDEFEESVYGDFKSKTRAFVKIQDGCNQFCSYCIIPFARGRCRSKPIDILRKEVTALAEAGHKEIVLVGINLAFYGKEFGLRLVDAVEECCKIDGIKRVRLGSLEPEVITDDDLMRLSELPQFCPQFHLSLQSGSEQTLKRMHRHYTPDEYFNLVCKIRKVFSEASITTDIMVGFPQESEEEFCESMKFVEKIGFAKIHVFQYSPRSGTVAAKMPQISNSVKAERAERMKALGNRLHEAYMKKQVGKTVPVLFERENSREFHQGYAPDYTLIKISRKNPEKSLRNKIFYVIIEESDKDFCFGRISDTQES
jgi:MiaB-like protein